MFAGILVTLREGIESFLVVGILIGILSKMGQADKNKYIWWGSGVAIALSIMLAYLIQWFSIQFEGTNAEVFEIVVAGIAIAVLSYMVIWLNKQSKSMNNSLKDKVVLALHQNQMWGLVSLAFVTIIREGIETALFLSALNGSAEGSGLMFGALIGLILAFIVSYLIVKATIRLNLRMFFLITGTMVVVIAAGLASHITMALQELGIVPLHELIAWDLSWFIHDESLLGKLLHAFIGYVAVPTVMQLVVYAVYIAVMLHLLWKGPTLFNQKQIRLQSDGLRHPIDE
ncbi:FTR1 family protein [Paenibacillus sp. BR2-3]|uniref:FTR1 family iron permease n=1 Tax=Paenibacillus sp. BR2-3 TaxID=3048494 RepID=UPI0039772F77